MNKERARSLFVRRKETLSRQLLTANKLLESRGSRQRLSDFAAKLETSLKEFEIANDKYGSYLDPEDLQENLQSSEGSNREVNACLKEIELQLSERQHEPPTPAVSILSRRSSASASSRSSEASKRARLAELKLTQAKREAEIRRVEERKRVENETRRQEEERKRQEDRDIRKLEYEAEVSRLEAQLACEGELQDPESLTNRLRDFNEIQPFTLEGT